MIQRIQTVYLALAGIAIILLLFMPFAEYTLTANEMEAEAVWTIGADGIALATDGREVPQASAIIEKLGKLDQFFMIGKSAIIALAFLAFIIIFLYKKRKMQMRLAMLLIVSCVLAMALMVAGGRVGEEILGDKVGQLGLDASISFSPVVGYFLPAVALAFAFLAWRAIRRDEKLVKSVDRIR
jgi:hypothetical protein